MRLRRLCAAAGALALVVASMALGVSAAHAAISPPVVVSPVDGSTIVTDIPDVSGTFPDTEPVDAIRVEVSTDGATWSTYCETFVVTAGAWDCQAQQGATLSDGDNLLRAWASISVQGVTEETASNPITVTFAGPVDPAITAPTYLSFVTTSAVNFAGTGTPGALIEVVDTGFVQFCSATADAGGAWACTATLPDGTHTAIANDLDNGREGPGVEFTVDTVAPAAPTLGPVASPVAHSVTPAFSGTGTPGETVQVVRNGATVVCTASVGQGGDWACAASAPFAPAAYSLLANQVDEAGNVSAPSPSRTLIVNAAPAPPAPAPTPTPAPRPTPPPAPPVPPAPTPIVWSFSIAGTGQLTPGGTVDLSSAGLPPGSVVVFELHSTPMALGSAVVAPDGTLKYTITVPHNAEPGDHHIVGTLSHQDGTPPSTVQAPVEVAPAPPAETEPEAETAGGEVIELEEGAAAGAAADARGEASGTPAVPRTEPAAPTAITGKVPTAVDVVLSPVSVATAGGMAIAVLLLAALPTEILNTTLSTNTRRFGRFFTRVEDATGRATEWLTSLSRTSAIPAAVLILITAIIFGFTDAGFGFDIASVRLVLSLGLGLFLVTWVASVISGLILHRRWGVQSSIMLQPIAVVFAIIGVVLARLLDFSPGFLIGLVIGLELGSQLRAGERVRAVVVQFAVVGGISVLAWLGYTLAVVLQGSDEPTFFTALLQDTLVATTAEGLTALMVAMLPIGFLDGKEIFDHSKKLWVVMFLVVGTLFSLLVLPTELGGQEVSDLGVWLLVLIGYCVVTLGLWLVLRATEASDDDESRKLEMVG